MIDTHCHLLPAIDDGPRSSRAALELAQRLVDAGVRSVVCTPHFSRRYPTDHRVARASLASLSRELARADLPLQLSLAAEVSAAVAVNASAGALKERQLGPGYLLVELESDTPVGLVEIVRARLSEIGLAPVFAHPERCRAVRSHTRVLDSARKSGGLVQVVARSLAGSWGDATATAAWHLLETGRVDLLASDAHRGGHAGGRLERTLQLVSARVGDEALVALTEVNPARVIGDVMEP